MTRTLLVALLLHVASPVAAYETPDSLLRAREDFRAVMGGTDVDLRNRLEAAWRQAEAAEDLARRHAVVRAAVNGATQHLDKATDMLVVWAKERRSELTQMLTDPEEIAGPRGEADAARKAFLQASDDWNILVARVGDKLSGDTAEEYATATGLLLRRLRVLADTGAPIRGRFLLGGFDRLSEQDSARDLHRRAQALAIAHQGGDTEAAGRVAALGWGATGPPSESAPALAALEAYRQAAKAFETELQAGAQTAVPAATSAAAPAPTQASAPAVAATGAALSAALDAEAAQLTAEAKGQAGPGVIGGLRVGQLLVDPYPTGHLATGEPLRRRRGGLRLTGDVMSALDLKLQPPSRPKDETEARYGRVVKAWTAERKAALDAAVKAGKLKDAQALYRELSGADADAAKARVRVLRTRHDAASKVAKSISKAPSSKQLMKWIPAGREQVPGDDVYLAETPDLPALKESDVALPAVAAYLPPPAAKDGDANGDAQVEAGAQAAVQGALGLTQARSQEVDQRLLAEKAKAEEQQRIARDSHLDAIRDAAFGAMPASCPEQHEVCRCPEVHVPTAHDGRCHPAGTTCAGEAPADLSFR